MTDTSNTEKIINGFALLDKWLLLYAEYEREGKLMHASCEVKQRLADMVIAEPEAVVLGYWEELGPAEYKCSVCGFTFTSSDPISEFKYCRCGAKMNSR